MLEVLPQPERQSEVLNRVLKRIKALHADSTVEQSDHERIMEGMSSQIIGETTRRAHRALIRQEARRLAEGKEKEQWDDARLAREIAAMKQDVTAEMFREHWFESTLSTHDAPIHAATYGSSMFRYDLRTLMAEDPSPDRLKEFGWIMFDVNGLRSFKDCTSHEHTTRFLRGIVRILVDPNGPTRSRLQEDGIDVIPMATGGDEFVLYLRGKTPLDTAHIDGTIASFQREVSTNESLRTSLDYDDERVLVRYGMPSRQQRQDFALLPHRERGEKLAKIRATLPENFIPSMAGGGALLEEGILHAVETDEHDLLGEENFLSIREKIIQSTLDLAESRQKRNKEADLARLRETHPRQHAFRLRNHENRALQSELTSARARIRELLEGIKTH